MSDTTGRDCWVGFDLGGTKMLAQVYDDGLRVLGRERRKTKAAAGTDSGLERIGETIEAALTIAETGHLVFATLHTNSAVQSINRIIDVFPPHQQSQVRAQLSFVLEGVMCQALLPRANGPGRVMALEVMVPNAAIRNLIREDKIHQIYSAMQVGQERFGMQTMNQSLANLHLRRLISLEDAIGRSSDPDELRNLIGRGPAAGAPGGRSAGKA